MSEKNSIGGRLKGWFYDADPASTPESASAASPASIPSFTKSSTSGSTAIVLDATDQQTLQKLQQRVYRQESSYSLFAKMRQAMGNPDLARVFSVLQVTHPDITSERVCEDIDKHLGVIQAIAAEFDAELARAGVDDIDGKAAQIADLTAKNEAAQREIAERAAEITKLDKERKEAEQARIDGQASFDAIRKQLTLPLNQAKELLSTLAKPK